MGRVRVYIFRGMQESGCYTTLMHIGTYLIKDSSLRASSFIELVVATGLRLALCVGQALDLRFIQ